VACQLPIIGHYVKFPARGASLPCPAHNPLLCSVTPKICLCPPLVASPRHNSILYFVRTGNQSLSDILGNSAARGVNRQNCSRERSHRGVSWRTRRHEPNGCRGGCNAAPESEGGAVFSITHRENISVLDAFPNPCNNSAPILPPNPIPTGPDFPTTYAKSESGNFIYDLRKAARREP
jgi:hypothetical protein